MTQGTQADLLRLITAYPGLHLRELARQGGLSEALAGYHVRQMMSDGLVEDLADGNYKRFFARRGRRMPDEDKRALGLLRQRIPLAMVIFLLERRRASRGDFVARLQLPKSTVSYHISKLLESGLALEDGGREIRLKHPAHVGVLLQRWQPSSPLVEAFETSWAGLYRGPREGPSRPK